MPPRSIQDHVQSLIGRTVAEQKVVGVTQPDVEARAILESIALNLLLKPRSVLYLAHLARNALLNVVTQELAAIDTLSQTVSDTANATFTTTDSTFLNNARTSLVQMEGLDKVDTTGNDFQRFDSSVSNFLNKTLSKSVRQIGTPTLIRPATEAAVDLPTDFSALEDLHTELNQRLFALSVGIENFTSSPLGTVLGLSTAYRARLDIEDVINIIDGGDAGTQARDIAVRVIGDRAALKSVGSLPVLDSLLIDTFNDVPAGYVLQAESDPATASATSGIAPFTFSASETAAVTVNGTPLTAAAFPQAGTDLDNRAFVVSSSGITYPITVPGSTYLFLHFRRATTAVGYTLQRDGSYLKQLNVAFTGGPIGIAQVLTDLNSALGSDATAYEYLTPGTSRIIIIGNSALTSISVAPLITNPSLLTASANSILGFTLLQTGSSGTTPIGIVVDALNQFFGSLIVASPTSDQTILLETILDTPGTTLLLALPTSMAVSGLTHAQSNSIRLFGTVIGVPTDPVDPTTLLDVGDSFTVPTGTSTIKAMTNLRITLQSAFNTFLGDVTANSALSIQIEALDTAVQAFLTTWLGTPYAQNLTTLDMAIAALAGKVTPATRNAVLGILSDLRSDVSTLASVLATGPVPSNIGTDEQSVVNGIINTLTERKYDKALSLLLQLQVQEFFEMTGDSASFGGALMMSMSNIATTDIQFPNLQDDEDSGLKGVVDEPTA